MAVSGSWVLLELGELANLTVMGSVAPSGIVPFSCLIAISASLRWSKRMKPTPFERPEIRRRPMLACCIQKLAFNSVKMRRKVFKPRFSVPHHVFVCVTNL